MTTFKLRPATVDLDFAGTDWEGLEVQCEARASLSDALSFQVVAAAGEDIVHIGEVVRRFGDRFLLSWNVVGPDDESLPPTGESLMNLGDGRLAVAILSAWGIAVSSVPVPSSPPSKSGVSSAAE